MMNMNYYGFGKGDLKIETDYIVVDADWADNRNHTVKVTHIPTGQSYTSTNICNIPQSMLLQICLDNLNRIINNKQ